MKKLFNIIVGVIILVVVISTVTNIVKYPEQAMPTARLHFMHDLDDRNPEALERYKEVYISDDIYLFDGPLTVELCAEKYNLDFNEVMNGFENSEYGNFQEYFDEVIK